MSITLPAYFDFIAKTAYLYVGIPVLIGGISGGLLNIVVFLSLRTFRQSSCAFYLMAMSVFDLGRFVTTTLSYVMRLRYSTDLTLYSLVYCKLSPFITTTCSLSSTTCLCLAIIDQYLATSTCPHWQQWCHIKLAHRLTKIAAIIWTLHAIPYAVFYNHIISSSTNQTICQITNAMFIRYHTYGYFFVLTNLLPVVTVVFGMMAYHNARHLSHRTLPLVRRELDKQLTVMVLVQVMINFCTYLPYSVQSMIALSIQNDEPVFRAKMHLSSVVTYYFTMMGVAVRVTWIIFDQRCSY